MNEIEPNLFIGDLEDMQKAGKDFATVTVIENSPLVRPFGVYIPILIGNIRENLDLTARMIDAFLEAKWKVLVHCGAGIERSPLTVAWYIMKKSGISLDDAYKIVLEKRPQAQRRDGWVT